jgi:hypothetical protein
MWASTWIGFFSPKMRIHQDQMWDPRLKLVGSENDLYRVCVTTKSTVDRGFLMTAEENQSATSVLMWGEVSDTVFLSMRERRLSEALTTDRHFEQEGFVALLRTQ